MRGLGRRLLFRLIGAAIALAIAGIAFLINTSHDTGKVEKLLNNDYYDSYQVYLSSLGDFEPNEAQDALNDVNEALDKIAAVKVDDSSVEAKIDTYVAEEKAFLGSLYEYYSILYNPDATDAEMEWALEFMDESSSMSDSELFYNKMYKLL